MPRGPKAQPTIIAKLDTGAGPQSQVVAPHAGTNINDISFAPHPKGPSAKLEYSDEVGPRVCEHMQRGHSLSTAVVRAGYTMAQFRHWRNIRPELEEWIIHGRDLRVASLENADDGLLSDLKMPQITARIFALKNARPEEWRDLHQQEVAGSNMNITIFTGVPDPGAIAHERGNRVLPDGSAKLPRPEVDTGIVDVTPVEVEKDG
jgi:hypothetical protein